MIGPISCLQVPSLPSLSVLPVRTHTCLRTFATKGSEDTALLSVIRPRKLDVKNLQLVMCWDAHWYPQYLEAGYKLWVRLSYIVGSRSRRNSVRLCLKIIIS